MASAIVDLRKRQKKISQTWMTGTAAGVSSHYDSHESAKNNRWNELDLNDAYRIPSALERLKCLFKSLNVLHPHRKSVYDLIVEIESCCDDNVDDDGGMDTKDSSQFETLFQAMRKQIQGHKLHGKILKRVLYNDAIMDKHELHGKVPLFVYLGDLLIVYFCMSHSSSSVIEGVSETKWMKSLFQKMERLEASQDRMGTQRNLETNDWYQLYLFFHTSFLRTLPLGLQMIKLGIVTEAMIYSMIGGMNYHNSSLIPQPKAFMGIPKEHLILKILEHQKQCSLTCTVYEFGPLGPAFRGRDNVTHIYFNPLDRAAEGIITLEHTDAASLYADVDPVLQALRENSFVPALTLMRAFRESKKLHPMNVKPPHVAFDLLQK